MMEKLIKERINQSIDVKSTILKDDFLISRIEIIADQIVSCFKNGGKLLICGNGGSASDALHMAGELVGRFEHEREGWPVIVLNADNATITAVSNDYGYENVFARQVSAFGTSGDVFLGISTSGNSQNIVNAASAANDIGLETIGLLGKDGGILSRMMNCALIVPAENTARIQESHIMIIHILCEIIEMKMLGE